MGQVSVVQLMSDLEASVRADRARRGLPLESSGAALPWSYEGERQAAIDREAERRKEAREGW